MMMRRMHAQRAFGSISFAFLFFSTPLLANMSARVPPEPALAEGTVMKADSPVAPDDKDKDARDRLVLDAGDVKAATGNPAFGEASGATPPEAATSHAVPSSDVHTPTAHKTMDV
jgi:hypothetical protein